MGYTIHGEEGDCPGVLWVRGKRIKNGVSERFQAEKLFRKEKLAIFAAVFGGKLRK